MKRILNITLLLVLLLVLLFTGTKAFADTLDITASDLTYATEGVAPDHSYRIVQLRAGQGAGFDIELGDYVCDDISVSFRTGNTEAGIIELHLNTVDGELLGEIDASQYSPRDWATILTANVKLRKSIKGNCRIILVNKKGTHTIHSLSLELKDPDVVIRKFSAFGNEGTGENHNLSTVSVNLLTQLGITEAETDFSKPITRADFALMLGKVIKANTFSNGNVAFNDVTHGDYSDYLNGLFSLGIIKGDGNGNFRPDGFIKFDEAASICVNALGYGGLYDYSTVIPFAIKLKLFKGLDISGEYLTGYTASGILCNLFSTDSLEIDSIKNTDAGYVKASSFIETNTDMFFGEGIVTSNYDTGLFAPNEQITNTVRIDGTEFFPGETCAYGYIGVLCKYFYHIEKGKKILDAIYPSEKCTVDVIKSSVYTVFNEISQDRIAAERSGNERVYKLNRDIPIIYNGIALDSSLSSLVDARNFVGTITIIASGNNIDCIWIDRAYSFLISDIGLDIVSDKLTDNILNYKERGFLVFKDGITVPVEKLSVGDVLTVYESANLHGDRLIRVVADQNKVSGEVEEISDNIVVIDGSEYIVSEFCHDEFTPGLNTEFKVNEYVEIVSFGEDFIRKYSIGLFMGYKENSNGFNDEYKIKMLTEDDGIVIFDIASGILIDGVRIKEKSYLNDGYGKFQGLKNVDLHTPVIYNLDDDGKLIMLDTVKIGADNDNDTLTQLGAEDSWITLNRVLIDNSWKYRHPLSNAAKFIYTTSDKNEDNYGIETGFNSPEDRVNAIPYSTKKDSIIADIIFAPNYSYSLNQGKEPFVFEKLTRGVNKTGDESLYLCGYNSTGKVKYEVDMNSYIKGSVLKWGIDSLKTGDLIQVSLTRSMVTWLDIIYLPGGLRKNQNGYGAHIYDGGPYKVYGTYGTMFRGRIIAVEDGFIKIGFEDGENLSYLVDGKMIFWSVPSKGRLETATGKNVNLAFNDEEVIIYVAGGRVKAIFSYRNEMP